MGERGLGHDEHQALAGEGSAVPPAVGRGLDDETRAERKRVEVDLERLALAQAGGMVSVLIPDRENILYSEKSACIQCGVSYPEFTPASFSFNSSSN